MLAFSIDYYGIFFGATQSVELFCTYFRRGEILFSKGLLIGNDSDIGWFTLLDARGRIKNSNNVSAVS